MKMESAPTGSMPRAERSAVARVIFAAWMLAVVAVSPATASNPVADVDQGYANLAQQRYQEAVEKFTRAIESGSLSNDALSRAYSGRAVAYSAQDLHEQAVADYESAIRLNADSTASFTGRGIAYNRLGQYERALEDFDAAIRLDPSVAIYFLNRGGVYAELDRFDEAIQDLDTAIDLQPSFGLLWYSRGLVYEELGDREKAKADFEQALKLSPDYPPIRMKAKQYDGSSEPSSDGCSASDADS